MKCIYIINIFHLLLLLFFRLYVHSRGNKMFIGSRGRVISSTRNKAPSKRVDRQTARIKYRIEIGVAAESLKRQKSIYMDNIILRNSLTRFHSDKRSAMAPDFLPILFQ